MFLHSRRLARSPIGLYQRGMGTSMGPRMLMLGHRGRRSGELRQVVLEIVEQPSPGTYRVVSGMGATSQWYRNLAADPRCLVSTMDLQSLPATAVLLGPAEVAPVLARYAAERPMGWAVLERATRRQLPEVVSAEEFLRVVDLVLDVPAQAS